MFANGMNGRIVKGNFFADISTGNLKKKPALLFVPSCVCVEY